MSDTGIILLAAGASARMGTSKQLLPWNEETLLTHIAKVALASRVDGVVVVLGAREDMHRRNIEGLPVTVVSNPGWETGMGSSIKVGLNQLITTFKEIRSVVILVCDQPFVTSQLINDLIDLQRRSQKKIIACSYENTVGVPVLFTDAMFHELHQLKDDQGAKKLILEFRSESETIDFPDGNRDVDTYEDYLSALSMR